MKKRSLFAAVAMLIVSALVLTSATYAWFNVGGDATIKTTRGSVMQAGTGIRLKTDSGMDWNSVLLPQDFKYTGSDSHFVQTWTATWDDTEGDYTFSQLASETAAGSTAYYVPMSAEPQANYTDLDFRMYSIAGDNHFQKNTTDNDYNFRDEYEFHVGTLVDDANGSDVEATFKLYGPTSGASAAAAARALVYISTDGGSTWTAYNGDPTASGYSAATAPYLYTATASEAAYEAIVNDVDEGDDAIFDNGGNASNPTRNYIMNSTDTGYADNPGCFVTVPANQMINASGNGVKIQLHNVGKIDNSQLMIRVVVWIEGQDANCAPSLGGGQLFTEWAFTYKAPSAAAGG